MILSESVIVKPNNHSINHYLSKGYDAKYRKELIVNVEDISPSSNVIINCRCDICGEKKSMKYLSYKKDSKNLHYCKKCKWIRIKSTKKEIYGNENYRNIQKYKDTMIKRYGAESVYQSEILMNKIRDTNMLKYNTETPTKNNLVIKEKMKKSIINNFLNEDIKKTIMDKRHSTCIEKYGVDNYTKTEEYKNKNKDTCLKKYGYEHNGSVPDLIEKRIRTRMLKGQIKTDEEKSDIYKYKRKVLNITRKYEKILFNTWNGYDFYDGEYIAENFTLKYTDKSYPSLDHRVSIYYGYKNNISPDKIGDISNLCITKKIINSIKRERSMNPL